MEQGIRAFLDDLRRTGDVHFVERPVSARYELSAFMSIMKKGPTVFFRRVVDFQMPVVGNLLNTREKIARALGVEPTHLQELCLRALDRGISAELVSRGRVHEIVYESSIDIPKLLPVPTWFEKEQCPYITAGVVIAKDPSTGKRNLSIARLRVLGENRLLVGIAPTHHLSGLLSRAREEGKSLEIAVAIGNHPAVLLASQMYVDLGHDEFDIAGGLLGEPMRLVSCRTVDLQVPADAEIVLEGTISADELMEEGPVSEFHGFYEDYGPGNIAKIALISHRRDPIFQAILPGFAPEHSVLGAVAIEATTFRALKRVLPKVQRVFLTSGGMGRLHAIITMHKPLLGEGKRAVLLAAGQTNLLKLIIVVNDDIDPEDWDQVEWALAARMRSDEDIMVLPGIKADRCEPQRNNSTIAKIGIVAARNPIYASGGESEFALPPREILERVRQNIDRY